MYMSGEETKSGVVIDNGSFEIKAGFAGDKTPRSIFRAAVGHVRNNGLAIATGGRRTLVGDRAIEKRGILNMKNPIREGIVTDWNSMENLWHHTFYESLMIPPEEHPVLMTDAPKNSDENRKKMFEVLFDVFNCPSAYVGVQAVLALCATGKTTGCVLDLGHDKSHMVPVFEGYGMPHATEKVPLTGRDLTAYLDGMLAKKGYDFSTPVESDLVRRMKEMHAYVADNFEKETANVVQDPRPYERECALPDGSSLYLAAERFACAEILFRPDMINKDKDASVTSSVLRVLGKCTPNLRTTMAENLVLVGGTSTLPGLDRRLADELQRAAPKMAPPSVTAIPERKYCAWMGGSILSSLTTFSSMCVGKKEFDEVGASIFRRKCFCRAN